MDPGMAIKDKQVEHVQFLEAFLYYLNHLPKINAVNMVCYSM